MNTYGIKAYAYLFAKPTNTSELGWLNDRNCYVLGNGSNILINDQRNDYFVISLKHLSTIKALDANHIYAEAGALLSKLIRFSIIKGLCGLGKLVGIPGSVGGAIKCNAGGRFGRISENIHTISCFNGKSIVEYTSINDLKDNDIIISAVFSLMPNKKTAIINDLKEKMSYKIKTQPLTERSAGCIFKNPKNMFAGELIEKAGQKGMSVNAARVSHKHANFIIADNGARSRDIYTLINKVSDIVFDKFGIRLEKEIILWGFDE
jgi:UDP-N-acetylmuramate dehydrogenase